MPEAGALSPRVGDAKTGRNSKMNTTAKEALNFIVVPHRKLVPSVEGIRQAGFYQLICSLLTEVNSRSRSELCERLFGIGESAFRAKDTQAVEITGNALISMGQVEGFYFRGLWLYQNKHYEAARPVLEYLFHNTTGRLKARIGYALGAVLYQISPDKPENALRVYLASQKVASDNWCDPYSAVQAARMVAVIKSIAGDRRAALHDLERLYSLARIVGSDQPFAFYDYLNSLAEEKKEANQLDEAERISRFVLASPLAPAYPEWRETHAELIEKQQRASRSVVAITVKPIRVENILRRNNVVQMPVLDTLTLSDRSVPKPAVVIDLQIRRAEMAKQQEKEQPQNEGIEEFKEKRQELVEFLFDEADSLMTEDLEKALEQLKETARKRRSS